MIVWASRLNSEHIDWFGEDLCIQILQNNLVQTIQRSSRIVKELISCMEQIVRMLNDPHFNMLELLFSFDYDPGLRNSRPTAENLYYDLLNGFYYPATTFKSVFRNTQLAWQCATCQL